MHVFMGYGVQTSVSKRSKPTDSISIDKICSKLTRHFESYLPF